MATSERCLNCGAERLPDAPEGLCPRCQAERTKRDASPETKAAKKLLEMAIEENSSDETTSLQDAIGIELTKVDPDAAVSPESVPGSPPTKRFEGARSEGETALSASHARGTKIRYFGDYEIQKELGRGGMGVVYKARQISLNRPVALKMVRAGHFANDDEVRRFENEAQAIAFLDHPGIVAVFEVGEHEGQKYFSMKLIDGGNLAQGLASFGADPRKAAALIADVAEAVHHAHVRGILHRDLKPANILIDPEGHPHVTDFGLARWIDTDIEMTATGVILGTPAYMSPEQASGHRGSITTATDVYGLGTVLYALLTGKAPFGGQSAIETLDAVRTRQPDRLRKFNARVPRDLETICLKCLEKPPARRYASARELALDLRNWLESRPLLARPVGPIARSWLWCCRKPVVAGLVAALVLALIGGTAGVVYNGMQVRHQRDLLVNANIQITRQWDTARGINNLLVDGLLDQATPLGRDLTIVELLDRISESVEATYQGRNQPKLEAAIHQVIGDAYRAQGKYTQADKHLMRATALRQPLPEEDELDRLDSAHSLAALRIDQGQNDLALKQASFALNGRLRLLGKSHPATIASAGLVAAALKGMDRARDAETLLLEYRDQALEHLGLDHVLTIRTESSLAELSLEQGRLDEAEERFLRLIEKKQRTLALDHPEVFMDKSNLGAVYFRKGDFPKAIEILSQAHEAARRLLSDNHVFRLSVRNNLAAALVANGNFDEASKLLGAMPVTAAGNLDEIRRKNTLAASLLMRGNFVGAERLWREVLAWCRTHPTRPDELAQYMANFAADLAELGKTNEAESVALEALGIFKLSSRQPTDPSVTNCRATLAWMLIQNGKTDQAEAHVRRVLELRLADPTMASWRIAVMRSLLGEALSQRGDLVAAEPLLLQGYATLSFLPDAPGRRVADAHARVVKLYDNWPGHRSQARTWRALGSR